MLFQKCLTVKNTDKIPSVLSPPLTNVLRWWINVSRIARKSLGRGTPTLSHLKSLQKKLLRGSFIWSIRKLFLKIAFPSIQVLIIQKLLKPSKKLFLYPKSSPPKLHQDPLPGLRASKNQTSPYTVITTSLRTRARVCAKLNLRLFSDLGYWKSNLHQWKEKLQRRKSRNQRKILLKPISKLSSSKKDKLGTLVSQCPKQELNCKRKILNTRASLFALLFPIKILQWWIIEEEGKSRICCSQFYNKEISRKSQ